MEEIKDYFLMERKLVRSLKPLELLLYIEFCTRARWNGNKINELGVDLPKGGFIFSYRKLAKQFETTVQKVRTAVQKLTHLQHIVNTRSTHDHSEFLLCRLGVILNQITHHQHADNTPITPNIPIPKPEPKKKEPIVRLAPDPTHREIAVRAIEKLNEVAGSHFRPTETHVGLIVALLKSDFPPTEAQLTQVITTKAAQWLQDPKMKAYLRPITLFQKSKFDTYLSEATSVFQEEDDLAKILGEIHV